MGFQPTTPVLERAKTVHASDRAATVIPLCYLYCRITSKRCLSPAFTLISCSTYSSTQKMEAICSSETSVDFRRITTWRFIPENNNLHNHRCANLKSYILRNLISYLYWTSIKYTVLLLSDNFVKPTTYRSRSGRITGTARVVYWSEFLATDPEIPGSIPGPTRFSEK
jgi:hypothetical protein